VLLQTVAQSEFARVISKQGSGDPYTLTLVDNLAYAQNSSNIFTQAQNFITQIDCTSITRIRVLVDCVGINAATGQTIYAQIDAITGDSIA
jgi:hypothetical protein